MWGESEFFTPTVNRFKGMTPVESRWLYLDIHQIQIGRSGWSNVCETRTQTYGVCAGPN
jgi:hypothetical protein